MRGGDDVVGPVAGRDRGSVTVESAVALSALVTVFALCVAGVVAVLAQVRVTDAAGTAARLAARGDVAAAQTAVAQLAPTGSSLELAGSELITATVRAPAVLGLAISARAVAAREPGP